MSRCDAENIGETAGLLDSSVVVQSVFPQSCLVLNKHNSKVIVPVNMRLFSVYIYYFKNTGILCCMLKTAECFFFFFSFTVPLVVSDHAESFMS